MKVAERLATSDPDNAGWQRDLWVSHGRVADVLEKQGDAKAREHWRTAHDVLAGMVEAGLHVSPQDRGCLGNLREKIGAQGETR